DYFPLLALLQRSLSEEEVNAVMGRLLAARPDEVHKDEIEAAIAKVTPVATERRRPQSGGLQAGRGRLAAHRLHQQLKQFAFTLFTTAEVGPPILVAR
ncbi:DUF3349 domain-containing protein, partial [Tsukamurella paurometabola]|uniref:DUF3349 domain-containing protein n=1 Tax=Tsukamurella paurometabola TaxID=2061 RepID=UPI001FEE5A0B